MSTFAELFARRETATPQRPLTRILAGIILATVLTSSGFTQMFGQTPGEVRDPSGSVPAGRFGNAGRDVVISPAVNETSARAQRPAGIAELGIMLQRGKELQASGRHQESQRHFEKVLRTARNMGPSDESIALAWLGSTYFELRRFAEAERALVRSLELRNKLWGTANERDRNHARILASLGGIEIFLRRYEQAQEHLNEALKIWRTIPGGLNDAEFVSCLNNDAMLHCARGRYSEAAQCLGEVVILLQNSAPPDDRRLAQARSNLAAVLSRLGVHDEADKFSSEALAGFSYKLEREPLIAAELLTIRSSVLRKAKRGREAKAAELLAHDFLRKTEVHQRVDVSQLEPRTR